MLPSPIKTQFCIPYMSTLFSAAEWASKAYLMELDVLAVLFWWEYRKLRNVYMKSCWYLLLSWQGPGPLRLAEREGECYTPIPR